MLGPEPDISKLYATKSGAKRIFNDAQVTAAPVFQRFKWFVRSSPLPSPPGGRAPQ